MLAPVCSSWVFVNQSIAKRRTTRPLGDPQVPSVYCANVMVTRTLLLQLIFMARGIFTCLEQPAGSLMEHHPLFQRFVRCWAVFRHGVRVRDYHLPAEKATWLYASHNFISEVDMFRSTMVCEEAAEMTRIRFNDLGKRVIDGGKDLKKSQAYTRSFAWSMCLVWRRRREQLQKQARASRREVRAHAAARGVRIATKSEIMQDRADMEWFDMGCLKQVYIYMRRGRGTRARKERA